MATFAALPVTRGRTAESERVILAALEKDLRHKGVFFINLGSYDSPNSTQVLSALSYKLENRLEFYIDLSPRLDEIWTSLSPQCRNKIRKATRLAIESRWEDSVSSILQLQHFQANALRRHGIKLQPRYEDALRAKEVILDQGRGSLLVGYLGKAAVCAAMFCVFAGKAYYAYSGSSEAGRKSAGPAHLIWKIIEHLKAEGVTHLNLGGATEPNSKDSHAYGLYSFKRDFGTAVLSQPAGAKTISRRGAILNHFLGFFRRLSGTLNLLRAKAKGFLDYSYVVPWCVPAWGWNEFRVTVQCILTGAISRGLYPARLVSEIKNDLGVRHALALGRGRVAIEVALRAMGISRGDEVVVPSYVCRSAVDPILRVGARPVFADVIGRDLHVTAETIKAVLTPRTKCVIVPHLFGNAAPVDEIEKLLQGTGIELIDDAAQSFGAQCGGRPVGTFGTCGIVSCGPGKALAGPAGGLLVTNSHELYERAAAIPLNRESCVTVARRVLSFWLWRRFRKWTLPLAVLLHRLFKIEVEHEDACVASTMSNLEAGIALEQFRAFRSNVQRRRMNAKALLQALHGWSRCCISDLSQNGVIVKLVLLLPPDGPDTDWFVHAMAQSGVECQKGYVPVHLEFDNAPSGLPNTEALWNRLVCIPIERGLKGSQHDGLFLGT
jgi:dTDP-4-amino-4,6-dideoxygalactose transaminase